MKSIYSKPEKSVINKLIYTLVCYFYAYFSIFLIKFLFEILDIFFKKNNFYTFKEFQISNDYLVQESNLKILFSSIIFAPIIEEVFFRLHLNLKNNNIIISIFCIFIFTLLKYKIHTIEFILFFVYGTYLIILLLFSKNKIISQNLIKKINFFTTIFFFGIFHFLHYKIFKNKFIFFYLINVMPMFIFGYYFSKIRLKFNIFWSILLHAMSNLIPCLIIILNR